VSQGRFKQCERINSKAPTGDGQGFVLYNGEVDSGFLTVFEPEHCENERDTPEIHALHVLDLIERLPTQRRGLWDDCQSRVFDFGFRSGVTPSPYFVELNLNTLKRIAAVGASIRITIHPMELRA
jgi:hypothetical protein